MNKKALVIVVMLAFSLLLTPLALARPGAEKTNEKFVFFELLCSGSGSGENLRSWYTPPNADPLDNKTIHTRGAGWDTGDVVELTIGDETFTMDTTPYNVTWTTTFDLNTVRNNDGSLKRVNIMLTDVVTVYDANNASIGELVLNLKSAIDFKTMPPIYAGTVQGYGTETFAGVKISGQDYGVVGPQLYLRNGTITGWPVDITNLS